MMLKMQLRCATISVTSCFSFLRILLSIRFACVVLQPLDRLSDCYLDCYRNTLLGDAAYNITKMSDEQIVGPWKRGFANEGACPEVVPLPCHGPQC